MAVARVNGHSKRPPPELEQLDLGFDLKSVPEPPKIKPCCERLGYGSWCALPEGHQGDHAGEAPVYGPVEERPELWRRHKGWNR